MNSDVSEYVSSTKKANSAVAYISRLAKSIREKGWMISNQMKMIVETN